MSISRRDLLTAAASATLVGSTGAAVAADGASLAEHARRKGLFYGCAVGDPLFKDQEFAAAVAREAGMLVGEYQNVWSYLKTNPDGTTNFGPGDAVARFAATHGQLLHGHALVWFMRVGESFLRTTSRAEAEKVLIAHVREMCLHYAGRMYSWNVVNEPLDPFHGDANGIRNQGDPLTQKIGPEYIEIAFHAARESDPKAMLVLNEAGVENDADRHQRQRQNLLKLIDNLLRRKVPLDAIGLQSHLMTGSRPSTGAGTGTFVPAVFDRFVSEIAARGLKIMVTELDVYDGGSPGDIPTRDREVAALYSQYLSVVLRQRQTVGVLTWGLSDRYSWITNGSVARFRRPDGLAPRPLPLDTELRPKPCYAAMAAAFDAAAPR